MCSTSNTLSVGVFGLMEMWAVMARERVVFGLVGWTGIAVSFDWNSSPNNMFFFVGNSSEPNLPQDGSIAYKIFSLWNCEVSSEAFPKRQIVCWIKRNASVAGDCYVSVVL